MDVIIWLFRILGRLLLLVGRGLWWLIAGRLRRPGRRAGDSHGSSRWATAFEQWWGGAITGHGIILGRGAFWRLVRFSRDGMVMVFAATGAGKGLGVVIPNLLTYKGSMLVTDPKGENYAITSRHRATLGQVRMMSPTDLANSDRYNPLDIIRQGTDSEADDAQALASLMVKPDFYDSHWDEKAASLLKALILHTLYEPQASRTLASVRRLSVGSKETFLASLEDIAAASPSMAAREIVAGALTSAAGPDGKLSDEFGSILSTLQKATEPWSSTSPAGRLSASSTFDLSELVTETSTLYLCVDEDVLVVYERWLRVMVGCALKVLVRAKANPPKHKVALLLDEVAVLGRLDPLENQSGLLRAYCTPVLIWQNLPQVEKIYGAGAKAFLANASARLLFGVNDNDTGQYLATMVGHTTTLSSSTGISHAAGGGQPQSHQQGQAESGYWLVDAAEAQRLPLTRAIIKLRNVPYAIEARRIDYRKVWRWRRRWDKWRGAAPKGIKGEPRETHSKALQSHPPLPRSSSSVAIGTRP